MKGVSEETKQVLASVDAGLKKLHTLDDSITLYEVSLTHCFINNAFYGVIIIFLSRLKFVCFRILEFQPSGWTKRLEMRRLIFLKTKINLA